MANKRLSYFISLKEATSICAYDFKHAYFSGNDDETPFVSANAYTYYIVINMWCFITLDLCDSYSAEGLLRLIKQRGLYATVKSFSDASQSFINGNDSFTATDLNDRALYNVVQQIVIRVCSKPAQDPTVRMAEVLQILRFPKRLTVCNCPSLEAKTLADFADVEKSNYINSRNEESQYVISLMRGHISDLFNGAVWNPTGYFDQISAISRVDGVTQQTGNNLTCKLKYLASIADLNIPTPYPIKSYCVLDEVYWGSHKSYESRFKRYWQDPTECVPSYKEHMVYPGCVPKTYKSYRIVAPEDITMMPVQYAILDNLEAVINRFFKRRKRCEISIHDQSQNSQLARLGSINGTLATIDWSHASDRVRKTLISQVFPNDVASDLIAVAPTHYIIPGQKKFLLSSYSTAGSPMTFAVECIVFWAMAHTACDIVGLSKSQRTISIHGDDTILPSIAAETLRDIGECLGMEFNTDKSYFNEGPGYRESCGEEYFHGMPLSSKYFPRNTVGGKLNKAGNPTDVNLATLLDLQHKFHTYEETNKFLIDAILQQSPKMTSSIPVDNRSDIWDPLAVAEITMAPSYFPDGEKVSAFERHKSWAEGHKTDHRYTREKHLTPIIKYTEKQCSKECCKTTGFSKREAEYIYDVWCYNKFLKDGPNYPDKLSELLGVSDRRLTFQEASADTAIAFRPKLF